MTYYIWFDESDKEGEFYSNFYGGILIKSFLILPPFYCVNLIFSYIQSFILSII